MGSGGSSSGGGESTIRYAPYIEKKHKTFLNTSESSGIIARSNNPYSGYTNLDFDNAFYGAGYAISSFPSLYDMFGKFMAGLDIEALWDQVLNDIQNNSTILNSVNSHRDLLYDDLVQKTIPRFEEGQRDMNSVMSSSFVIGKAVIEQGITKKVAEYSADLRYKLIPVAAEIFSKHLTWNSGMITTYLEVMKLAILTKFDTQSTNYDFALKEVMWPFSVLEQERANLGALQGAVSSPAGGSAPSTGQKVLGGAMAGASMGATAGPWGAAIGGVVGGLAGAFS